MAITYAINGSTASLQPLSILWNTHLLGHNHNGAPIYAGTADVTLTFETASPTCAQQWLTQSSGGTSVNLTIPDRWQLNSTILSSVYLELTAPPTLDSVNLTGFTITVRNAAVSALEVSPGA